MHVSRMSLGKIKRGERKKKMNNLEKAKELKKGCGKKSRTGTNHECGSHCKNCDGMIYCYFCEEKVKELKKKAESELMELNSFRNPKEEFILENKETIKICEEILK